MVGDERRFKQVLINLIKNALKFTSKGGKIEIFATYEIYKGMIVVVVKDTGVGIAYEDLPKLFNRFGKL